MAEPIIKPSKAEPGAQETSPAAVDLDAAKPAGTTEVDAGMTFEVEALAHEAATELAKRIRDGVRKKVAAGARIVFLDAKLAAAVSMHRSFLWQCKVLIGSFRSARDVAARGTEWLAEEAAAGAPGGGHLLRLRPRLGSRAADAAAARNRGVAAPAGGGGQRMFTGPGLISGLSTAVNLLGYFGVDTSYSGRSASVSERALVMEVARMLTEDYEFSWPSLDFVLHDRDGDVPGYLQKLSGVTVVAEEASDRIQLLAELVNALEEDDERLGAAQRKLDQAHQLYDSSSAVLDQLKEGFFSDTARHDMTPSELIQLGERLVAMEQDRAAAAAGGQVHFLTTSVEKAGGSYRIRRHLWQAITLEPPLTFTGGCIVSFALLDADGEFTTSGTSSYQVDYRAHPRQWSSRGEDLPAAIAVRRLLLGLFVVVVVVLVLIGQDLVKPPSSIDLMAPLGGAAAALALAIFLLGRRTRRKTDAGDEPTARDRDTNRSGPSGSPDHQDLEGRPPPTDPPRRIDSRKSTTSSPAVKGGVKAKPTEVPMPTIRDKERIVRQNLTKADRENVYEVERFLDLKTRQRTSLRIRCPVYPQDPAVAAADDQLGIQEIDVRWEPSIGDGPTSARVAVVDYNGDTGVLVPPAKWDADNHRFLDADGDPIAVDNSDSRQFDQVNAWAIVESVLEYFENPRGLGRRIPWGFDGNRLIVVPHAGYDENAYYDRRSKSLQLYYFGDPDDPKYTCLSHDIVAHETGHAVLDGIRPSYNLNSSVQTAAFHEFMGDLTAILLALRNNYVRSIVWKAVALDLSKDRIIANLAEEFGRAVNDSREEAYLRTAHNDRTLEDVAGLAEPHAVSEVLTGAMFDLLTAMAKTYSKGKEQDEKSATPAQALWRAIDRFGRVAIQPLDLCPPMDIQFVDYARAVVRNFELVDPVDERGLRQAALEIFHRRGLCPYGTAEHDDDACALLTRNLSYLRPTIYHDVDRIAASRTHAYHFLHDNRKAFRIPAHQDFVVADLYRTHKMGSAARRLPTEVVVEYVWRQPVVLEGARFRQFEGQTAPLLCGGTLVLDGRGNIRSWFRKPGTEHPGDAAEGNARRKTLLDHLARQIAAGRVALAKDVEGFGVQTPPVVARTVDGLLSLESSPHFRESEGAEPWHLSF